MSTLESTLMTTQQSVVTFVAVDNITLIDLKLEMNCCR